MNRNKHTTRLLPICLVAVLILPCASTARGDEERGAAELVTDYLRQDIFLRPGVGLKKVKLGMDFENVLRAWGPPTRAAKTGISESTWVYEVADHTRITLVGGNRVQIIRVTGGVSSPYVTTEGASFGMAKHQLATIYGRGQAQSGRINYDHRGIGFGLDHGQVSEIQVFFPD